MPAVDSVSGGTGRAEVTVRARAHAPGRVNLIGDHTDYTGGLVLPVAIDLGTTVDVERLGSWVVLVSADEPAPAVVPPHLDDVRSLEPTWARYVAAVAAEVRPTWGAVGSVHTTLPVGAGLSSSAALEVAVALALGATGSPLDVALLCQRAEHAGSGLRSGVMDQLASTAGVEGAALLIDCRSLDVTPVPLPGGIEIVAVHSGQDRALATSGYGTRRAECEAAGELVGPLRDASPSDVERIAHPVLRRRARHVVSENLRVLAFADALAAGRLDALGPLMAQSHESLRRDFEVSTPVVDALVARLVATPGVLGARLTGGGFGGAVVALVEPGTDVGGWRLAAAAGATVTVTGRDPRAPA